jgi:2Fe-2S ferredoxin
MSLQASRARRTPEDIVPKVTFRHEGKELTAEVPAGTNLLEAAEKCHAREGHACGGVCACSTCHVYVTSGFNSLVPAEDREQDILDKAFDVKPSSRLGCQAEVTNQDVTVVISEESLRAWYDENPKERAERDERLLKEGKAIPPPATDLRKKK